MDDMKAVLESVSTRKSLIGEKSHFFLSFPSQFGAKIGSLSTKPEEVTTIIFGDEEKTTSATCWDGSKKKAAYEKEVKRREKEGVAKE